MKLIIKRIKEILILFLMSYITLILFLNSESVKIAVIDGMLLCFNVIVPALFPFLVLSLFISKSKMLNKIPFTSKWKNFQTYLNIFILSNIGGYPIGAKLLSDAFKNGEISKKDAQLMLLCCINGGPAFTILVIGAGILRSSRLGIVLYFSQFLASFTIFLFIANKLEKCLKKPIKSDSLIDSFVSSVSDSSASMINMSGFIIVCSVILNLIKKINNFESIKKTVYLSLEISNAILTTRNIFVLSFILGFASISIILQVFYFTKNFNPNKVIIFFSRIITGLLSTGYTFIIVKTLSISVETLGNINSKISINKNSNFILSILFLITCLTFIYSVANKKYCGKISTDIF